MSSKKTKKDIIYTLIPCPRSHSKRSENRSDEFPFEPCLPAFCTKEYCAEKKNEKGAGLLPQSAEQTRIMLIDYNPDTLLCLARLAFGIQSNSRRRVHQGAKRPSDASHSKYAEDKLIICIHCIKRVSRSVFYRTRIDEFTKERSDPRTYRVQSFHVLYSSVSFWGLCPESLFITRSC